MALRWQEESARMKKSISSFGQQGPATSVVSSGLGAGSSQDFVGTLKTDLTKITTIVALLLAVFVGMIFSKIF